MIWVKYRGGKMFSKKHLRKKKKVSLYNFNICVFLSVADNPNNYKICQKSNSLDPKFNFV